MMICVQNFKRKLEVILEAWEKYRKIAYDIQGFKDAGTDVLLREENGEECDYICFQLKSEGDINHKDLIKNLKAQWFDTHETYKAELLDYYIVLCCNSDDKNNKAKIRSTEGEFKTVKPVHVIEPEYALSFLSLPTTTIDAVLKSKLGSEDVVFRKSLEIIATLTPTERALVFYLLWKSLYDKDRSVELSDLTRSDFLVKVYDRTPRMNRDWFFGEEGDENESGGSRLIEVDFESRVAIDLDYLSAARRPRVGPREVVDFTTEHAIKSVP